MANHKVATYSRGTRGNRERQPAGPNVVYPPGTTFQIRYKDGDKRVWKTLSATTYLEALVQAKRQELELFQRDMTNYDRHTVITRILPKPEFREAVATLPTPKPDARDTLGAAIDTYVANIKVMGRPTTLRCYKNLFRQFYACVTKNGMVARSIKSVTKQDLIDYYSYLEKLGNSEVTRHCKLTIVQCLLRASDNHAKLKTDYETKVVSSYRPDEIQQLFAVAAPAEKLLFRFFLHTGGREMEVANATWDQIDFVRRSFTIRQTKGFKTKSKKPRIIPLSAKLVEDLKAHMLASKGLLLFPGKDGKPDDGMRYKLAKLHERAGVPQAPGEGLHRWRKTFATQTHRNGTDVVTIQARLGHSSLATTQRYIQADADLSAQALQRADDLDAVYA